MTTTLHTTWALPMAADLAAAERSLLITSLSFQSPKTTAQTPLWTLCQSLALACARGVAVAVALPAPQAAHPATAHNANAMRALQEIGVTGYYARPGYLLHAKTCVIDDSILWVGSGNWTAAASSFNLEIYTRTESPELARQLTEFWNAQNFMRL